jgi:high-affinity iron transporter
MEFSLPGLILGFREALEAFLVLVVLLRALERSGRPAGRKPLWLGAGLGVLASVLLGFLLQIAEQALGDAEVFAAGWALASNLLALGLITVFLVWMIRQGGDIASAARRRLDAAPSPLGILVLAFFVVGREGAEVALFAFAGEYPAVPVAVGVLVAFLLSLLVQRSLVRIDLKTVFRATLLYLVLQAGYLAGSGMHEALSLLGTTGALSAGSPLLSHAFDLSGTFLDRETSPLGVALNILVGWNSDPEWPAFVLQYLYTGAMLLFWSRTLRTPHLQPTTPTQSREEPRE